MRRSAKVVVRAPSCGRCSDGAMNLSRGADAISGRRRVGHKKFTTNLFASTLPATAAAAAALHPRLLAAASAAAAACSSLRLQARVASPPPPRPPRGRRVAALPLAAPPPQPPPCHHHPPRPPRQSAASARRGVRPHHRHRLCRTASPYLGGQMRTRHDIPAKAPAAWKQTDVCNGTREKW